MAKKKARKTATRKKARKSPKRKKKMGTCGAC
jgi:hypothetical protein